MEIPKNLKEFIELDYNLLVDDLNTYLSTLSLTKNFNSQIIEGVEIPAGGTVRVSHQLDSIPSYRIIARQVGGGAILDAEYSRTFVDLINSGNSQATISVILFKE